MEGGRGSDGREHKDRRVSEAPATARQLAQQPQRRHQEGVPSCGLWAPVTMEDGKGHLSVTPGAVSIIPYSWDISWIRTEEK